jgi:hypothetical protein
MGAAVSKRRAKRAAKREARASSSSSSAAAASSTAAKNGAGGASGAGAGGGASGKQECTACQRSLAALDHAQLTCGHRLCDQCAATCVDDVVSKAAASSSSAPLATLVCRAFVDKTRERGEKKRFFFPSLLSSLSLLLFSLSSLLH